MTDMTERKEPIWDIDQKTVISMAAHLNVAEHFGAVSANCTSLVENFDFRGWVCFRTPLEAERFYNHMKPLSTQRISLGVDLVIFNA